MSATREDIEAIVRWINAENYAKLMRPMEYHRVVKMLKETARRAGVKKRIYPHLFRHSAATRDARYLTESELKLKYGWVGGSDMAEVYVHLSWADLDNKLLAVYAGRPTPNLVSEIIESELPGVLNWLLEGLRRLIKNGWRLSASQTTEEIRLDYIRRSDTVKAFIEDAITVKQGAYTPKNELYDAYVDYCRKNKYQPLGDVAFFKGFERNGIDIHNRP
ncbi:MAG: primase-like DNA-binding domain-containing protein [Nitrososphaeria archaeon]